jgi:hypothetical protein
MKNITTAAGHKILKISFLELSTFGTMPPHCDSCNAPLLGENHYIPVMHSVYCNECYTRWSSTAKHYPEDNDYEALKLEQVLLRLNSGVK